LSQKTKKKKKTTKTKPATKTEEVYTSFGAGDLASQWEQSLPPRAIIQKSS
jgi:hypothetical protein